MDDILLRKIEIGDLQDIARIHIASFSDRALSQLGTGAVRRYYHELLTGFQNTYNICAVTSQGYIAGFMFSGLYSGSFGNFLKKNTLYLALQIITHPWLLANPIVKEQSMVAIETQWHALRNWLRTRKKTGNFIGASSAPVTSPKAFGLLSIAVDPAYQHQGVAQRLMLALEEKALSEGFTIMELTVHPENLAAVKLYEKMNWKKIPDEKSWFGRMIKYLE